MSGTYTLPVLNKIGINTGTAGNWALTVIGPDGSSANSLWGLVRFDKSAVVNQTKINILTATLGMYMSSNNTATSNLDVYVKRSLRDWVPAQVTRDIYKTGSSWQTVGGVGSLDREDANTGILSSLAPGAAIGWKDITMNIANVQEMIRGTFTDNGFMFWAPTGADTGRVFSDFRLVITYTFGSSTQPIFMD